MELRGEIGEMIDERERRLALASDLGMLLSSRREKKPALGLELERALFLRFRLAVCMHAPGDSDSSVQEATRRAMHSNSFFFLLFSTCQPDSSSSLSLIVVRVIDCWKRRTAASTLEGREHLLPSSANLTTGARGRGCS